MPKDTGDAPRDPVSPTELAVLKALWDHGPATVREIHRLLPRKGRRWAYTTVLTLLQRLQAKGYVSSAKEGIALVFTPRVSRDGLVRHRLRELAAELTGGSASPLVHALVEDVAFSEEELEGFRELLDRIEGRKKTVKKKKTRKRTRRGT